MDRFLSAIKKTILTCATVHLVVLIAYAVQTGRYRILNLFNILDFDLFEPSIIQHATSDIIALGTVVALFVYFFFFS